MDAKAEGVMFYNLVKWLKRTAMMVVSAVVSFVLHLIYFAGAAVGFIAGCVTVIALAFYVGITDGFRRGTGYGRHTA